MIIKTQFEKYLNKLKLVILTFFLIISSLLNYLFQVIHNTNVVFSHFFYIPTILACLWWKKKGLIVPIFLAISLIFFPFLFGMDILTLYNIDNLLRALFLIIIGIIISFLSEEISKTEELNKAYEDLIFYRDLLTHDINNIIQHIKSATELYSLYRKNGKNAKDLDMLIDIIRDQGFRGMRLVSNAQQLANLEDSEMYLENVDVNRILEEAITFLQRSILDRELSISIDTPDKKIWVIANELLLDMFENIIINSVKYNDNPNVEINVNISRKISNGINYIKIEIIDNGIGIPDERKEIIFKRKLNKDKYSKGMGFGLSIVNKIIAKYNGKIWVEDKISGDFSQGSKFNILIPEA